MDEFERRLVSLLDAAVPEPRNSVAIEDLRELTHPRHASARQRVRKAARRRTVSRVRSPGNRRRLAVAGAIVAAALVAVGSYALTRGSDRPQPGTSTAVTDPAVLTSTSWRLISIVRVGAPPEPASAPVFFSFGQHGATDNVGDGTSADIGRGRITLGSWSNDLMIYHAPHLEIAQSNFVFVLMQGSLNWSIHGDQLTLRRPGGSSLVFQRADYDPKHPPKYGVAEGRFMAVGGPPGVPSPRPISGVGTVIFTNVRTAETQTVDTDTGGEYGTAIAAGTYAVAGHIASYQDGHAQCAADKPIVVGLHGTARVDVYCQEP